VVKIAKKAKRKPSKVPSQKSRNTTTEKKESTLPAAEKYKNCSICRDIPPSSSEFWKGGELQSGGLPGVELKLEIVGSPYYDDSTSYTHSCIKRCPECGTIYLWEMEYEYLVNGSEDDITLTRLSEAEGEKAVQRVLEGVKQAKQRFWEDAQAHLQVLEKLTNQQKIERAAGFFSYNQLIHKEDISFAVPALTKALEKHRHTEPKCDVGRSLFWVLREFADKDKTHKQQLLDLLQTVDPNETTPEVLELIQYYKHSRK
jgi:hypothetical protein